MKIAIIGGAGRVGSSLASALQWTGLGREIVLVDADQEKAEGEALDLQHGAAGAAAQIIRAGAMDQVAGAGVVVITAGSRRRPDESRLELIDRNVALFRDLLRQLQQTALPKDCTLVVISNPVDVLTYIAAKETVFTPDRVIGLGTMLDTIRLRSLIGRRLAVDPRQVDALVLGEHGDSMVPVQSTATVNGTPLAGFPGYSDRLWKEVTEETRNAGATVLRKKGGAGYAVAVATIPVLQAIMRDTRAILPVSTLQRGYLGMQDVCLSVPTIVGRNHLEQVPVVLWPREERALKHSAEVLHTTLDRIRQ